MVDAQDSPQQSTSFLSGVFHFVSREIGSFVTTATGGTISQSPTTPDRTQRQRAETASRFNRPHNERKIISRRRESREISESRSSQQPHAVTPPRRKKSIKYRLDDHERAPTFSHPPPRCYPFTMPGSLYPRSPSLMPGGSEYAQPSLCQQPTVGPSSLRNQAESGLRKSPSPGGQGHASDVGSDVELEEDGSEDTTPFRSPYFPSVKAAVNKFSTDDADPSLLLPSPLYSPSRPKGKSANYRRSKSPQRPFDDEDTPRIPYAGKGKGRAYDIPQSPLSSPTRDHEMHVRGKEQELLAAKERQRRNERRRGERELTHPPDPDAEAERVRDKERIKMLEAEIMRLKAELSKRAETLLETTERGIVPPPPPPPPPPPAMALRIPVDPATTDPESLFASARAALKPAGTPVEAPINPVVYGSKRKGQPTVGVPPEKMAAFLSEMKTVKLRRVNNAPAPVDLSSRLNMSFDSATLNQSDSTMPALRLSSSVSGPVRPPRNSGVAWRVGEKRKRDPRSELQDVLRASKRQSLGSVASESVYSSEEQQTTKDVALRTRSTSLASNSNVIRSWPSISTEPEIITTTPSLCSDIGHDDDTTPTSPEDQPPSTPIISLISTTPQSSCLETRSKEDADSAWTDLRPSTPPNNPPSQRIFSKRPPMSPLPAHHTPRKPKPPSRIPRVITRTTDNELQEHVSTMSLPSRSDLTFVEALRTLDTELREAGERPLPTQDDGIDEDSGIFVGAGTKSKRRGFLAHGGAGGAPVFLGEGYVEDVEVPSDPEANSSGKPSRSRRDQSAPTQMHRR